jgi:predicted phosphodiesterase
MRLAILADIHGNLPAFEAALDHLTGQRIEQVIIAGDVVNGAPDSEACWRLAQSLGCPILRGNHERYIAHYGTASAPPEWETEQFAPIRWAAAQFTPAERCDLANLPLIVRPPETPELLIVHASLRNDRDTLAAYTPEEQLAVMFPEVREGLIIRGHNHVGQVRLWGERSIITVGSVGLALDGHPTAQYLILERCATGWRIQHQSVPYDVEAAVRRFQTTGYLEAAGPMGRLFMREVATASHHLVPFSRMYTRWSSAEGIPLEAAVNRYLSL